MVAPMAVRLARVAFFLDVIHVAIRGEIAVPAHDTATTERRESEEPHETTHTNLQQRSSNFRTDENIIALLQRHNGGVKTIELFGTLCAISVVTERGRQC